MAKSKEELQNLAELLEKHSNDEFGSWDPQLIRSYILQAITRRVEIFVANRTGHLDSRSLLTLAQVLDTNIDYSIPIDTVVEEKPRKRGRPPKAT